MLYQSPFTKPGNFIKFCLFIFLPGLISLPGFSQTKPNYSLLWRISGNGLKQPSYLFGTMHVKDKRAFQFSDSVMLALQRCEAFAMEVHPDTLLHDMFTTVDKDDSKRIRDMLTDKQYNELAKRFEQKNGYPMGEINSLLIENLIDRKKSKPDDKNTFVDAYLLGIANTLGKGINGLEKSKDQINFLDDADKLKSRIEYYLDSKDTLAEDAEMDKLTNLYAIGNLDDIYNYLSDNNAFDSVLIARNMVMLNSMVRYMAGKTLFTAVGVAHLTGNNGLLALLRRKGYTVTCVNASFTGVSDQFKIGQSRFPWVTFTSKDDGYTMEVPGTPIERDAHESSFKIVIYPDMVNELYYGAYALPMPLAGKESNLQAVQNGVKRYKAGVKGSIIDEKIITVNNMPGIGLVVKAQETTMRMQFVAQNNMLYCLYLGNRADALNQPDANRFFNSFKIIKRADKPFSPWIDYKNAEGAFSVSLPAEPQVFNRDSPSSADMESSPYVLHIYSSVDEKNKMQYLVRYNDLPTGKYMLGEQEAFAGIFKSFKSAGSIIGKPIKIHKSGFEGRSVKLNISKFNAEVNIYIRGNRQYFLLRQSTVEGGKLSANDNFFSSFKFADYQDAPLLKYMPADGTFSMDMFSKTKTKIDTIGNTSYLQSASTTFSTNPSSGAVYCLEYIKMEPYYRAESVDTVYKKVINDLLSYQDTLLRVDTILFDGNKGREFVTQTKSNAHKKRHRLFINNQTIIYLTGYMNSDEYFSTASNRFFNSYVKLKDAEPFDIKALKGEKLLGDLQSGDTTIRKEAKGALSYYDFAVPELPFVYAALKRSYPDDTLYQGVRKKLINKLIKCHTDATLNQLDSLYHAVGTPDELKLAVLRVLPIIDKQKGYSLYFDDLTRAPFIKLQQNFEAFLGLEDSLEYAAANFKRIIPLLQHRQYRQRVLSLAVSLFNHKNNVFSSLVKSNYKVLANYAYQDLDSYLTDTSTNAYNTPVYYYLQLMEKMPGDPEVDSFTAKMLKKGRAESQLLNVVRTRIANHLVVPPSAFYLLLDSIGTRYDVMAAYNKINQLNKVPLKYRAPVEFGRVCMYNYVAENSDEEAYPDKIGFLGTMLYQGTSYHVYKFSQMIDGESRDMIGVYEHHKTGPSGLDFKKYNCFTNWKPKKANWQLQAQKLIAEWKKTR